jgi:RNA polymerase primary sigma factor
MRQLKISKSITNRESPALEKYLQDISRIDMITSEEEVYLARLIKQGDMQALDKLTRANLRFVVSVAKQYQNQGLTLADLINEGNLGLIKAAQRFDETRGFKFISYAVWWIRQSIMQALAEQARMVRIPLNKVGLTNKIFKTAQYLEQQFEREPSAQELAFELDMPLSEVEHTLSQQMRHTSIDAPFGGEGDDICMADLMANPDGAGAEDLLCRRESLSQEVERVLGSLTVRQAEILKLYFGLGTEEPLNLEDIGDRYKLTRERVRQIKDKALMTLRDEARSNLLKEFLGY